MVMSATQMLAARVGLRSDQAAVGTCAVCGGAIAHGVPLADVCGSLTTDTPSFRAAWSEWCCDGCALVRGRSAHPVGRESGWYCNFSHFIDAERVENASKGEKPKIMAWLRGPKRGAWACAIADTGQKHVLCYAPTNPPGARGRVQFEEATVALPGPDGWALVDEMAELLTMGATKEGIESGAHNVRAWQLCGPRLRAFEDAHGGERGGGWFALALWLAQRDEEQVAARIEAEKETKHAKAGRWRKGTTADATDRVADGAAGGVPPNVERKAAGALADPARQDAGGGKVKPQRGRVDHADDAVASDPTAHQLGLFDDARAEPLRAREGRVGGDTKPGRQGARMARGNGKRRSGSAQNGA